MRYYSLGLIFGVGVWLPAATVAQTPADETVTVRGFGQVSVSPDVGVISLTVESTEATSDSAASVVATVVQRIAEATAALNVSGVEVATESYLVQPGRRDQRTQQPIEYKATANFSVRVGGVTDVGEVIDAALRAGAVQIRGVQFEVSDSESLRRRALAAAIADANAQAEMIAEAMGVELVFLAATTEPPQMSAGSLRLGTVVMSAQGGRPTTPISPRDAASTIMVTMRYRVVRQ